MIRALLSRRLAVALLLAALSAMMARFALSLRVDPGIESMIPSSGPDLKSLREFNATFGSDETIVLALHSAHLFSVGGLKSLEDLTRRASRLPHVVRVLSPTNLRDLEGDELGPFAVVPYEKVLAGEIPPEGFGRRLASHPLFGGLLVSRDARTAAALIEVERIEGDSGYRSRLVREVRSLAAGLGPGMSAYVAGIPVEKVDVAASVKRDQMIFAPLIFAMLTVVTAALYRHPVGVIVPLGVVAVSLLWTLGLLGMAGRSLDPVTSLVTPVILVVSVAGAIHLINHHLAGRADGLSRTAALERAFARSWAPCLNAALTTAIGFGSLLMLPIPAIRAFGLFTSAGVMIAYALTMTLAPLLLATLPDFPPRVTATFRPGPVEQGLKATVRWIGRHPRSVATGALAVLALAAMGVARIRVETDLIRSLRSDSPLYRATMFIDRHLTGVNSLEILARGVSLDDPTSLSRVDRFERSVRRLPGIRNITGLPDLLARVNRAFHAGQDAYERLPEGAGSEDDLADFRDLLRREAPAEWSRFVSADGRTLRLAARVTALDTASSQALFGKIREAARRAGLTEVTLTGNFVVLSDMSTSLVRNQIRGLVPALGLILAAMVVQFRSVRLGLLSAIPNGAPVLMVYGLMGWSGIALSVPTAMIACIAVGMTVDNTIHLLARFRKAFGSGADYVAALETMIDSSGRAVVFSTVTVAVGFWVGVFSSFLPTVHFAVLTGAALLLGLACEAVLLPLVLILFRPLGGATGAAVPLRNRATPGPLLLPVLLVCLGPAVPAAAPAPRAVLLKDQFGRSDGPGLHRGETVLLLYGKATGLRRMRAWEVRILGRAPGKLRILRAVDARSVRGRKTEAEVDERLRRSVPPEISVLVDWNGDLAKVYGIPETEVAATVLDPQGRGCGSTQGPANPNSVARVLALLAEVRKKGRCP